MPAAENTSNAVLDMLIVGSGFSGLCLALQLQKAGKRWKLFEREEQLGGTWRDNHYPGAACDVPSNLYSLSFMPNPEWTRLYPPQSELWDYMNRCADLAGIRANMTFSSEVIDARWIEKEQLWCITIAGGEQHKARSLTLATGGLSRPQMPKIDNLDQYRGVVFHSSQWPENVDLSDKRVAVIGTGASAIQIVPAIAEHCASLTLFQRTPAWIIPRMDRAVSERRREIYRRHPWRQKLARALTYMRLEWRAYPFTRAPGLLRLAQKNAVAHLESQIADPEMRQQLTPNYTMGCKRILLSDNFYPALLKPNVRLVDHGVVRATPAGVVSADGEEHPVDIIIAATGFQVADAGPPFMVTGREGNTLERAWQLSAQAYLGTVVSGFPNLFIMTGPNTGLGHNSIIYVIESQTRFILQALRALERRGVAAFDVRLDVQERFNHDLQDRLVKTVWNSGGCRSWYLTADGRNDVLWPDFTFRLRKRLSQFHWDDYFAIPWSIQRT